MMKALISGLIAVVAFRTCSAHAVLFAAHLQSVNKVLILNFDLMFMA